MAARSGFDARRSFAWPAGPDRGQGGGPRVRALPLLGLPGVTAPRARYLPAARTVPLHRQTLRAGCPRRSRSSPRARLRAASTERSGRLLPGCVRGLRRARAPRSASPPPEGVGACVGTESSGRGLPARCTHRSCRFSRLQRFDPRVALRACCIPQPIMGFTGFSGWSPPRRLGGGSVPLPRRVVVFTSVLPVPNALQSLPPACSRPPACRPAAPRGGALRAAFTPDFTDLSVHDVRSRVYRSGSGRSQPGLPPRRRSPAAMAACTASP